MVIQFSIGESLYQVYRLHTVQAGERKNSGKPNLVTPSLAKLDLETLKRDIPNKYLQNMPQAASDAWKAWLEDVESELTSVPAQIYDWPVDKLKTARRTAPHRSDAQIPNDVLEQHCNGGEIQPTPKVSIYDQY